MRKLQSYILKVTGFFFLHHENFFFGVLVFRLWRSPRPRTNVSGRKNFCTTAAGMEVHTHSLNSAMWKNNKVTKCVLPCYFQREALHRNRLQIQHAFQQVFPKLINLYPATGYKFNKIFDVENGIY